MSNNSRRNNKPHVSPTLSTLAGYPAQKPKNAPDSPGSFFGDFLMAENAISRNQPWESAGMNSLAAITNLNLVLRLALSRFRWEGLPDTCNARFLEWSLITNGMATFAYEPNDASKTWLSLKAVPLGKYSPYGEPLNWQALGYGDSVAQGDADGNYTIPFNVEYGKNGVIIYENVSWINPWPMLRKLAMKLTRYDRTEDINLAMQFAQVMFECPKDQKQQLINTVKGIAGFEPITMGIEGYANEVSMSVLTSGVPLVTDQLHSGKHNIMSELYTFLGIDHLAFEKNERMTDRETGANDTPTGVFLADELKARQDAAEWLSERIGSEVTVSLNDAATVRQLAGIPEPEPEAEGGEENDGNDAGDNGE